MKIDSLFQFQDQGTSSEANMFMILRKYGLLHTIFNYGDYYPTMLTVQMPKVYRGSKSDWTNS